MSSDKVMVGFFSFSGDSGASAACIEPAAKNKKTGTNLRKIPNFKNISDSPTEANGADPWPAEKRPQGPGIEPTHIVGKDIKIAEKIN